MAGRNVGAVLKPPDGRSGWVVTLTLPGGRVELSPGEAVGLLRQLTDAVREWTRQTAAPVSCWRWWTRAGTRRRRTAR